MVCSLACGVCGVLCRQFLKSGLARRSILLLLIAEDIAWKDWPAALFDVVWHAWMRKIFRSGGEV